MRSSTIGLASTLASAIVLLSTTANACRFSESYMHSDRSDLRGDFAAEVEVTKVFNNAAEIAFEARVVSILHGTRVHSTMQIRRRSPCAAIPEVGKRGVVMGCLDSSGDAGAVIKPFVQSGFYFPPHMRERDC